MSQYFRPASNTLARSGVVGGVLAFGALIGAVTIINLSPHKTQVYKPIEQPVPFSHEHHVKGLGLDCRFCHTSVEDSSFAGLPSTHICMTCHSQLWNESPMLKPVRDSLINDRPLHWQRVHNLPDYVYFNHAMHVAKGVGCETCHGRVDEMPLTWKEHNTSMSWCLNCHRDPTPYLRPKEKIFTMGYQPSGDQQFIGRQLLHELNIKDPQSLTDCTTCHR